MSLYKRQYSQFWWFQIWKPDGKRMRQSTGTADKAKAAIIEQTFVLAFGKKTRAQKLIAMLESICEEEKPKIALKDVGQIYASWSKMAGKETGRKTLLRKQEVLKKFVKWTEANCPNVQTTEDVQRAVASNYVKHLATRNIKDTSRRTEIQILITIWNGLQKTAEDIKNPWPDVLPAAHDTEHGKAYTPEQETRIYEVAKEKSNEWLLACIIARHTGLRYGSIAQLKWQEIDLEKALIKHTPPKTKKHGIQVVLPISQPLKTALEQASKTKTSSDYVLPKHAASYPHPEHPNGPGTYASILKEAGLENQGYTFHSWRHTFRTRLSEARVSAEIAKRLGGWTNDKTANKYDHAERLDEMREAVEKATGIKKPKKRKAVKKAI